MSQSAVADWLWQGRYLIYLVVIAWIVSVLNFGFLGKTLNFWGVRPRTLRGLVGIFIAPFLHGDWRHLEGNSKYFLILGGLIVLKDPIDFAPVTLAVTLINGFGIWLVGASRSVHVGASGVVFGYLGFLLLRGFVDRNLPSALITVLVAFFYAQFLWGVLPTRDRKIGRRLVRISWEGHFFGLLGGFVAARYLPNVQAIFEQFMSVLTQLAAWLR
ncbi:rhomboid family intramembrane serine protease [Myxacorys almedinensis]|uniref:Rhomboid family intramembrane serine protease n=1 Tax=Myxacorys almedinensis A TaxID=2690445 RepID=A0A8J7Z3V0_9CYAN|nr:rhomboid family intramembrane serine protease [Myxacorys almedinensis]NDJ19932.1 rhomboid family intramembrane serine protease [Myxacorys almedinensis A]